MTDGWTDRDVADLADDYELIDELGRGASAVVYRARDRALGRLVAIKVVRPHAVASGTDALERLAREARTVARLAHPNIVTLYAVRRLPSAGGLALVMQLVPGGTLKDALAAGGALPPERAEAILRDVAAALAYANARGIVHRDVKPENIFLDEDTGRALLADFGIAWSVDQESRLTLTGAAIGTPTYMAPEQIDGAPPDARSDLYSLGLVAWEMLTGQRPWAGESLFNVILKQKTAELPPMDVLRPGVIPDRLQYIVERMLQKHPGARWAGAEAALDKLERWIVPGDYPQWQQARQRRREEARRRATQASPAVAASPSEVATVVFRRDGGAATPETPAPPAVDAPQLVPVAADADGGAPAAAIEERPPSWVLEAEAAAPLPPRRRFGAVLTTGAVLLLMTAALVPSIRTSALALVRPAPVDAPASLGPSDRTAPTTRYGGEPFGVNPSSSSVPGAMPADSSRGLAATGSASSADVSPPASPVSPPAPTSEPPVEEAAPIPATGGTAPAATRPAASRPAAARPAAPPPAAGSAVARPAFRSATGAEATRLLPPSAVPKVLGAPLIAPAVLPPSTRPARPAGTRPPVAPDPVPVGAPAAAGSSSASPSGARSPDRAVPTVTNGPGM